MAENWDDVASKWIAYTMRRHPETGDLKNVSVADLCGRDDAAQKLLNLVILDPCAAFEVIGCILNQTSDPWVLENLGAGPLEDLLSDGDDLAIASVKILSKKHKHTVDALKSVWTQNFPLHARQSLEKIISMK